MFDTSVSFFCAQNKHSAIKKMIVQAWNSCICACMHVQLYVLFLLFVCVYIYTCVSGACTLLSLAALTNIQHKRCMNPEFMRGRTERRRGRGADKNGTPHGEPLSTANLLRSDKMNSHSSMTMTQPWPPPLSFSDPWCAVMSPGREKCLALK